MVIIDNRQGVELLYGLHSLHTVRFYEPCQNPFVTKMVRTSRGKSLGCSCEEFLFDTASHSIL